MPDRLGVLCVHGIGHGDADTSLVPSWTDAITQDIHRWTTDVALEFEFLRYDDLFDHAPLNAVRYGEAVASLLASGVVHGIGDALAGTRGLCDIPDQIRWTAGMIAQWASEDRLRDALRRRVLAAVNAKGYGLVCAHSLGSLICYDTFRRNPGLLPGTVFLTFGSQIGNPFVRDCFAGRIEPLDARMWYHLYNPEDHMFTTRIRLDAPNFAEVLTEFDKPDEIAYEMKDTAQLMVSSEETEPAAGWPYAAILKPLAAKPSMSPADLATLIVVEYGKYYQRTREAATQSALDLGRIPAAAAAVNELAELLLADLNSVAGAVSLARDRAQKFEMPEYIDLGDFAAQLAQRLPQNAKAQAAVANVRAALDPKAANAFVIQNATSGTKTARATGVSIYFPHAEDYAPDYSDLLFSRQGKWRAFLQALFTV